MVPCKAKGGATCVLPKTSEKVLSAARQTNGTPYIRAIGMRELWRSHFPPKATTSFSQFTASYTVGAIAGSNSCSLSFRATYSFEAEWTVNFKYLLPLD